MHPIEILLVCLFITLGFYSFIDYRRNPTRANRNYLIIATAGAMTVVLAHFLLTFPNLSDPQRESIRGLIAFYFAIGSLFLLIGGAITLYLQYWRKKDK